LCAISRTGATGLCGKGKLVDGKRYRNTAKLR